MTSCTELDQALSWQGGTYIDWSQVDLFLTESAKKLLANDAPFNFPPEQADVRANFAWMILSSFEMMYGQDLRATLPSSSNLLADQVTELLDAIVAAQNQEANSPIDPSLGFVTGAVHSGNRGWWGIPQGYNPSQYVVYPPPDERPEPFHFMAVSANFYMALRRNPTGLSFSSTLPVGLEHKLVPYSVLAFPAPANSAGGGLCNLERWSYEIATANALRTTGCAAGVDMSNYWGELIGVVCLIQAMQDLLSSTCCLVGGLEPTTGMGSSLVSCFQTWRLRQWGPGAYMGQVLAHPVDTQCPCEWDGPGTEPWVSAPWPYVTGNIANPNDGQDWDCSLHQLTRAVLSMHHIGYSLSAWEQSRVFERLSAWTNHICLDFPNECGGSFDWTSVMGVAEYYNQPYQSQPIERGEPCDYPLQSPLSPTADAIAAAATTLIRSGLLSTQPIGAVSLAERYLRTLATMYRAAPSTSMGYGWINKDISTVASSPPLTLYDEQALVEGTFFAIAALLTLDQAAYSTLANCSQSTTLQAIAYPNPGLDNYFDVFGGSLASANAPTWVASYVPG